MGEVVVQKMTSNDIDDVSEVEKLSFKTPWSKEAFENEISGNLIARYVVAKMDGRIIGYGGMWLIIDEGHVTNVAVHPDFRGMHIGDLIISALINLANKEGAAAMTLEVRRTNYIAQNLYKKYGFEPYGIRPKYYADSGEDAVIMWKKDVQADSVK